MITGLNHSGFIINDVNKMKSFYCDILGLKIEREVDSIAPPEGDHTGFPNAKRKLIFVGAGGEHLIELVYFINPKSPDGHLNRNQLGASHICFNVDNISDLYKTLSQKGIKFVTEPKYTINPEGKNRGVCYAQDPEGNWLEFIGEDQS
jgi:catechol 2,3-dioxygenase-like lactoylglutathione lyase family enzyme